MSLFWLFLICPFGYILGCVNFSIIISKLKKDDIRKHGSGNPGTMNVWRTYGMKWGLLILLLDALKGAIPALAAMFIWGHATWIGRVGMLAAGLAAIIGHMFPIFYKFKGGKGVATTFGIFWVMSPLVSLIALAVAAIALIFMEYGVLASFIFITSLIVYEGLDPINYNNITVCLLLFIIFLLIWYMHRKNIARLLIGKENKVTIFKNLKNRKQMKLEEKLLREVKEEEKGQK